MNTKEIKDILGGFAIITKTIFYKNKLLRVNKTQKDKYIEEFGTTEIKYYDEVLNWLILNFYNGSK